MIRVDLINVDDFNDFKFSQGLICWYTNIEDELKTRIKVCTSEVFPRHCGYDITIVELKIISYNCNSICSNFSSSCT